MSSSDGSKRLERSHHHLFWYSPEHKHPAHFYYGPETPQLPNGTSLTKLRKHYSNFSKYLDFRLRPVNSRLGTGDGKRLRTILQRLDSGSPGSLSTNDLRTIAHQSLTFGIPAWIQILQRHLGTLSPVVPHKVTELIRSYPQSLGWHHELIFKPVAPHFYLWRKSSCSRSAERSLLICFTTRTGTANMPLSEAHLILQKSFDAVLYVIHQPSDRIQSGIAHLGIDRSRREIEAIMNHFGYDKAVGLGTSYGGLSGMMLTEHMPFMERFLSFSGPFSDVKAKVRIQREGSAFDTTRLRLVLSANDQSDLEIKNRAIELGLKRSIFLADLPDHGSFSASHISGELTPHLNWLMKA